MKSDFVGLMDGFNFICGADFIQVTLGFHREHKRTISLSTPLRIDLFSLLCFNTLKGGDFMEIKAKCKFDKDSIRALAHLSTFKKSNPKKTVITRTILCLILLLVIVAELVVFDFDVVPIILIVVDLLVILIDFFMYFGLPKIQYKALAKMKDAENEYIFCDNVLKTFTKSQEYNGEAEIEYSLFVKVYETTKYFFMYQTNNQVFIVDKSTIEGGTVEEIRNKLSAFIKDKYILCKY